MNPKNTWIPNTSLTRTLVMRVATWIPNASLTRILVMHVTTCLPTLDKPIKKF